ncbi:methyltransferase domain-containing protein [bacterium]|nr:methyltransferase domain-containing protein [candidate division CSSED10-310 bacterium]
MSELNVTIERLNLRGIGLGKDQSGWLPIPGSIPGERMLVQIVECERNRRIGRIIRFNETADNRVDSGCVHFPDCPGCRWRHIRYRDQSDFLLNRVFHLAEKDGVRNCFPNEPMVHLLPVQDHYRTRCTISSGILNGRQVLGMRSNFPDSPIIDLSSCPNHHPELNRLISQVAAFLNENNNLPSIAGDLRDIELQLSSDNRHRVVFMLVGQPPDPSLDRRIEGFFKGTDLSVLRLNLKSARSGKEYKLPDVITGDPWITFQTEHRSFRSLPNVWTPVGDYSGGQLLTSLEQTLGDSDGDLLEIGCGAGQISLSLAGRMRSVMGIDKNRLAVESANVNCGKYRYHNVLFRTGEAIHVLRKLASSSRYFDTLIIHGMRIPFGSDLFMLAGLLRAKTLILISPSAGSWVRDISYAVSRGWALEKWVVFDQIPHTAQFLLCGSLRKRIG